MIDANGFGERLRTARGQREVRGRVSYEEIADAVAERTGRKPAHRPTSVGRWFKGESVPDVPSIWALANFFGVDPGWLAFGDASDAPAPAAVIASRAAESSLRTEKAEVVKAPRRKKAQK